MSKNMKMNTMNMEGIMPNIKNIQIVDDRQILKPNMQNTNVEEVKLTVQKWTRKRKNGVFDVQFYFQFYFYQVSRNPLLMYSANVKDSEKADR